MVRSDETVLLNQWNRLSVHRHRWDATVRLNNGKRVAGRSKVGVCLLFATCAAN